MGGCVVGAVGGFVDAVDVGGCPDGPQRGCTPFGAAEVAGMQAVAVATGAGAAEPGGAWVGKAIVGTVTLVASSGWPVVAVGSTSGCVAVDDAEVAVAGAAGACAAEGGSTGVGVALCEAGIIVGFSA